MDTILYLERAENEIVLSNIIFNISNDKNLQSSVFEIVPARTFYSAVITHAYYSMFYAAKAYLIKNKIFVNAPNEHVKVYEAFSQLVDEGKVDVELLRIYSSIAFKAEVLLHFLQVEKRKRGNFTYHTLSQANQAPAKESIDHAQIFLTNLRQLCFAD